MIILEPNYGLNKYVYASILFQLYIENTTTYTDFPLAPEHLAHRLVHDPPAQRAGFKSPFPPIIKKKKYILIFHWYCHLLLLHSNGYISASTYYGSPTTG